MKQIDRRRVSLGTGDYRDALDSRCAIDLLGLVWALSDVLPRIAEEVRSTGGGPDDIERHPIARLYAERILFLSGGGGGDSATYLDALLACERGYEYTFRVALAGGKVVDKTYVARSLPLALEFMREGIPALAGYTLIGSVPHIPEWRCGQAG